MVNLGQNIGGKIFLSFSLWFFLLIAQIAQAETAFDQLVNYLNNLQTMTANFEQFLLTNKGESTSEKIKGKVILKRPGKLRWEITQPNQQLVIVNVNQSIVYDAELEQLVKKNLDPAFQGNPATLLSSTWGHLRQTFKVVKLPQSGAITSFQLFPNNSNSGYRWIKITFNQKRLDNMEIADNLGQISKIMFSQIKFNVNLPSSVFTFNPPKNIEIINLTSNS